MSQVDEEAVPAGNLLTMRIIVGALALGPTFFLGVILFLIPAQKPMAPLDVPPPIGPLPLVSAVAVGGALVLVPLSVLLPAMLVNSARRKIARGTWTPPQGGPSIPSGPSGDVVKLLLSYQTALIVGSALNEGCAFLATVAYMLERLPWVLGLAALLIVGVAARFPTRGRLETWLAAQQELIEQERQEAW